jgi:biopolymer transport protein ExbB
MVDASAVIEAIERVLTSGGPIAVVLALASVGLWTVATLRALALRRGFSGDVADLVRASLAREREPFGARGGDAIVPRFVAQTVMIVRAHRPVADLERVLLVERDRTEAYDTVLHSLVASAPLLGLLGTVDGMVETFASLYARGGVALTHATEQTVAGGISLALVTTQLGLIIGIPGLAAAHVLRRVASERRRELMLARTELARVIEEAAR